MGRKVLQKSYYWMLVSRAFLRVWKKFGAWGTFLGLIISAGVAVFKKRPKTLSDLSGNEVIMTAEIFLAIVLFALLVYILREPIIIYNEQENAIDDLESKLKDVENSRPVIVARNPMVKVKGFVNNEAREAISIDVLNIASGTTAEKVFPTVTWFTMRGKFVTENPGRWWMSTEDALVTKTADRQLMDLLSNGKAYLFHFAIQSDEKQKFFAWYRESNGTDKRFDLLEKKYKVKIHFQSNNNAEADFAYIITNNDGKLFIKEIKK
jgi:hypothetical protein